jgi:hypothetical protein
MAAVLTILVVFVGWSAVGLAVLAAAGADTRVLRLALVAPVLGSAVTALPLFALSNLGVPMASVARPTVIVLAVCSLVILAFRRPSLPVAVVPVLLACLASVVLVGRPMFTFGFHWLANANGDMAYYVLSATSLLHHGLLSPVDWVGVAHDRDFATTAQALHGAGVRAGTDVTLSGLAATTGLSPTDLYMPMGLAINLSLICASGALAMQFARKWWAASVAAVLVAVSPMTAYGLLQQLLPQVWGLGLAAGLLALLMRPEVHQNPGPRVFEVVPIAILAAGLFIVYPELAASLVLAYLLYVGLLFARRQASVRALVRLWIPPIVLTLILVNQFVSRELRYVSSGVHSGVRGSPGIQLFGYSLVPSALPGILGLQSLFASPVAPHMGAAIVVAFVLLLVIFGAALVTALRGSAASVVVLGDFALGALLAFKGSDFGLFKLYMYCQPFLAAAVAGWITLVSKRVVVIGLGVVLAGIVAVQIHTQSLYAAGSRNPIDLPHASGPTLVPAFRALLRSTAGPIVPVTDNDTLITLEGAIAGERPLYFDSRDVFGGSWKTRQFELPHANRDPKVAFKVNQATARLLAKRRCTLSMPTGSQWVLNRRVLPEGSPDLVALRCGAAKDLLVFVVSSVGQSFTLPKDLSRVSFWQLEKDPSFPGRTFSGFGRYALLKVLNPSKSIRLELELTTSSIRRKNGSYALPPASVVGAQRVHFPVVGEGAARVVSPPLRPQWIDGQAYVLLDSGLVPQLPPVKRPGLTSLWGTSVPLDPRHLSVSVRNVSVLTAQQYAGQRPPSALQRFPSDLARKDLEYAGIFEDGWVGSRSYAVLAGGPATRLTVRADVVPGLDSQHLVVRVDGRRLYAGAVKPGQVNVKVHIPASRARRRVDLEWARVVRLPAPDGRRVAAHLDFLGMRGSAATVAAAP